MAIDSKVYLALPTSPAEKLTNGTFETVTGDDFGSWTETSVNQDIALNGTFEAVAEIGRAHV